MSRNTVGEEAIGRRKIRKVAEVFRWEEKD